MNHRLAEHRPARRQQCHQNTAAATDEKSAERLIKRIGAGLHQNAAGSQCTGELAKNL